MNAVYPIRRLFAVTLMTLCMIAAPAASAGAERWPTSEFVFEKKDPGGGILGAIGNLGGYSSAERAVISDYEKYLSEVAAYFQSLGLAAPALPRTKGRQGGEAYAVYLFDYDDTQSPAQFSAAPIQYLRIDLSRAIVGGRSLPRIYEDLPHEIFHAIQASYRGPNGAIQADWIIEGAAQSVGMEAADRLRGIDVHRGNGLDDYRLGGRHYFEPLTTSDTQKAYRTASLWRYIGEHVAAARMNARAGVQPIRPDFSYLAGVFGHPYSGAASHAQDLRWLDAGLEKTTGIGLNRHYAAMVSTLSGYMPERWTTAPKKQVSPQEREDGWRHLLFGRCDTVKLSAATPSGSTPLDLRMNASRCFKAEVTGAGRVDLSIQLRADTAGALEALFIGTEGGDRIGAAQVVPSPSGGGYIGHWRFRIATRAPQVFIIANMADNPASTQNLPVTPELTLSRWDSSMSTPRPQERPKATGGAPAPEDPRGTARSAAADEVRTALASLSNQSASGARVSFSRERVFCTEDFADVGCPSNTTLHLALTPGGFGDLTQTTGTGGLLGQFMSKMSAIADNGLMQTDRDLKAIATEIAQTEGTSVTISLPLIEYGFTGSFDKIAIRVNGGADHGAFEARGPADAQPGVGRKYLHSGRVTIAEFTPYLMRGTFSANLTDLSKVEFTESDQDKTLPIDRTISGSFVVAAPWEGDPRVANYQPQTIQSGMQDLAMVFPGIVPGAPTGTKAPAAGASGPVAGTSTGASLSESKVDAFPTCSCSCQPLVNFNRPCRRICRPLVQQCRAGASSAVARSTAQQEQSALAADMAQMRADFERHLIAKGMAELKDAMLAAFDSQTTDEDKRRVVMSYGMSVAKYGNDAVQRAAANPAPLPTRQQYIDGLKSQGLRPSTIDKLVADMDALMAERGGWPK